MKKKDDSTESYVKQFRMAKGWSQGELAEKIDVRRQAIYDIESGRYLPNTTIALKLAKVFQCRVEDLFMLRDKQDIKEIHLVKDRPSSSTRLALGRVRDKLVGFHLNGEESIHFGFSPADGILNKDGKTARIISPMDSIDNTIILMGCDPALEILGSHVSRKTREGCVRLKFASSYRAIDNLAKGVAHVAGTHLHNTGKFEANVILANKKFAGGQGSVIGFSLIEEGLIVAKGNPKGISDVVDLTRPGIRFLNRESGAALRVLLDDQLLKSGITDMDVNGYRNEVSSHREGAYGVASNVADVALGLRAVADAFDLDFIPITVARCDLVIPADMIDHPTIKVLQDVLQSSSLSREINAIPGYDSAAMGSIIAEF